MFNGNSITVVIDCLSRSITFIAPIVGINRPLILLSEDNGENMMMIEEYKKLVGSDAMGKPIKARREIALEWSKQVNKLKSLLGEDGEFWKSME